MIQRQEIDRTGKNTLGEYLQTLTVDGSGSVPKSFGAGFASGASGVSLRGLGAGSTLVLINGRRIAPYGLADDGQKVFTDLSIIPLEAVERVEVLKDGASSIYGSDAIAGVVNVILRRDFNGAILKGSYGVSGDGDGDERKASLTWGTGDLAEDGFNFFFSAEASKSDEIYVRDRKNRKWIGNGDISRYGYDPTELRWPVRLHCRPDVARRHQLQLAGRQRPGDRSRRFAHRQRGLAAGRRRVRAAVDGDGPGSQRRLRVGQRAVPQPAAGAGIHQFLLARDLRAVGQRRVLRRVRIREEEELVPQHAERGFGHVGLARRRRGQRQQTARMRPSSARIIRTTRSEPTRDCAIRHSTSGRARSLSTTSSHDCWSASRAPSASGITMSATCIRKPT